jgi:hypothetical protein
VFRGTIPRGGECPSEFDVHPTGGLSAGACKGESSCWAGRCASSAVPKVGLGEPCHPDLGVACSEPGASFYCGAGGVCRPRVGLGESCDTPRACDSDTSNDFYLYCSGITPGGGELGECRERIPVGSACDPREYESCEFPGYCSHSGSCIKQWPAVCKTLMNPPDGYDPPRWFAPQK